MSDYLINWFTLNNFPELFNIFDKPTGYINTDNILSLKENTFTEIFDYDKLNHLIKNWEQYESVIYHSNNKDKDPLILAKAYKKAAVKPSNHKPHGVVKVTYKPAKNDVHGLGRLFANKSLSLQGMCKSMRHIVACGYYYDIDFVNCHPVIIEWLCHNFGIDCTHLSEYILNRDAIINELVELNEGRDEEFTYERIKTAILSVIYSADIGGSNLYKSIKKNAWIESYLKEMNKISGYICEKLSKFYELRKDIKDNNIQGSTLSFISQFVENQMLLIMLNYFHDAVGLDLSTTCLCFDGFLIKNTIDKNEVIRHLSILGDKFSQMGIPMKIKVKEMTPMPLDKYKPILHYDMNDNYYWDDFINPLIDRNWECDELGNFISVNINRVVVKFSNGEFYLKCDSANPLVLIKQLPRDLITFKEKSDDEKFSSASFGKLITSRYLNLIKNYSGFCFDLNEQKDPNSFNTWNGFKAKQIPINDDDIAKIQMILDHIKVVWAGGNEEYYRYILSWFHQIFKYPHKKSKIALVLRSGKQQAGKGIIVENFLIPFVFGENISMYDKGLDFLTNRFNDCLMGRILAVADELSTVSGNYHQAFDALKSIITGNQISIEIKGGKKFSMNNYANLLLLTNNQFTIKVEDYDARFAIFDCSNEKVKDFKYFNSLAATFSEETANIFFSYIHDMKDPAEIRDIPQTQIREDMQLNSLSSPKRFIHYVKETISNMPGIEVQDDEDMEEWQRCIIEAGEEIKSTRLYNVYKMWCSSENEPALALQKFGREVKDIIEKRRNNQGVIYRLI